MEGWVLSIGVRCPPAFEMGLKGRAGQGNLAPVAFIFPIQESISPEIECFSLRRGGVCPFHNSMRPPDKLYLTRTGRVISVPGLVLQIIVLEDTKEYIGYADRKEVEAQDRRPFNLLVIQYLDSKHPCDSSAWCYFFYTSLYHTSSICCR